MSFHTMRKGRMLIVSWELQDPLRMHLISTAGTLAKREHMICKM